MDAAKRIAILYAVLGVMTLLFACSGTMRGMVQQGGESVNFQFEDTGMGYGKLRTTLSDGEAFDGKFVEESSSGYGTGFGTAQSGTQTGYATSFAAVQAYSGNIEAVLFGNKGHTMKCRFRASDSVIGLPSGGVGVCQVSDGRIIDVLF